MPFLLNKNQEAELLGHKVVTNLALQETVKYLSKVVIFHHFTFYTPTNKIWESQFLYVLGHLILF